ncbi:prohead protease/major capsid protein fusion protein [Selenomonas noxia]|uniref:prohead protease/major capsid protein fusion protein n=1 Tax=Selenomonas noxia TaxID=135083 RepID=UPI00205979F4|nr:prohead protease/major capsid protein fusion protein [Selenomonas noxia]DAS62046.1 MAG TPA: major capsid protein [Caudoviricetes sp.]DAY26253.1 MAG TPA: major capsid protein [Caudoviricetes sp.]
MAVRNKNEPQRRTAYTGVILCRTDEADEDTRQAELSLSSEEPCRRWFGDEILSHDAGAIDLSRLKEIGVVLFNHNRDRVIGRVLSVRLDEVTRKLRAVIQFDEDEESECVYQKVRSGTLKGVSVGYTVDVWEEVKAGATSTNGRFTGPCEVATRWTPYELSIVSVPADATVGIGRSYSENGDGTMDEQNKDNGVKAQDPVTVTQDTGMQSDTEAARQAAIAEERARVREIGTMCRQFGVDDTQYIDGGMSVGDVRAAILAKLAAERTAQTVTVQVDEMDKFRAAATDGLALRAGLTVENKAVGADEYRGKRMIRLAAECVEREQGKNTRAMDDEMIVREALTGTGAFPGILSNVAHKSMAQAYQTAPTTYQLWTAQGSNSDFKDAVRYRLSEADTLEKLNESGEFKASGVTESMAKTSVATYGRMFSITRQAIINDDMGALQQLPAIYGAAARRMINKMVYKMLKANPTIEGDPLFSNNHNTLHAVDISIEGLAKMKAAMAKQKNIAGLEYLNIQPAFLICPVELEVQAAQLISSVVDPTKANATPNPFANKMTVISEPELEDAKVFYLAAAAGVAPTIEVTSLNGNLTPTMERAEQFDTLGIKWRIYMDVGVNLLDYRGIAKSTGK